MHSTNQAVAFHTTTVYQAAGLELAAEFCLLFAIAQRPFFPVL
jgi:hypothetical protein